MIVTLGGMNLIRGLTMDNTEKLEKLLRAFIEVSGFDIKETIKEGPSISKRDSIGVFDEFYIIIDYKLTKKEPYVPITAVSKEWDCICSYVLSHRNDILTNINDYGDLLPMLEFFSRNSK